MLDDIPTIEEGKTEVEENSKILCFTDGIVEMENESQVEYGTKYMEDRLLGTNRIDKIIDNIIIEINEYKGKNNFFDDIALIGIDFH